MIERNVSSGAVVRLIPVLEVAPFGPPTRPLPDGPSRLHPAAWDAYFQACLVDAGFAGVTLIQAGSRFASARALVGHALLEHVVREALVGTGLPGFPWDAADDADTAPIDRVSALDGGLALTVDGAPWLMPECCGDLGNIADWEACVVERPTRGELWIGHPGLAVAWCDGQVRLAEQWEYPPAPDYLVAVTLGGAALAAAVADARAALTWFRAALVPVVARVLGEPTDAAQVTARLLGGARGGE